MGKYGMVRRMASKTGVLVALFLGTVFVIGAANYAAEECPDDSQDKAKYSADQKGGIGSSCSDGSSSSS